MEDFLPKDNGLQMAKNILQTQFTGGEQTALTVTMYWGVKSLDRSGISIWDPSQIGTAQLSNEFNPSAFEAQKAILDFCIDLRKQEFVLEGEVSCWLEDFDTYVQKQTSTQKLPINSVKFDELLLKWMKEDPVGQAAKLHSSISIVNGRIIYFEIKATAVGNNGDESNVKKPIYEKWKAYLDAYRTATTTPASARDVHQTAGMAWAWMPSEAALVVSGIRGVGVALIFGFVMLILTTCNIYISLIAVFCVAMVIFSVLAIIVANGWQLGVAESICLVIIIGLSIDFVVHLASSYQGNLQDHRSLKMKQAFE